MGNDEESGLQGCQYTRQDGHCSCGCNTAKVESDGVPESLTMQVGGDHYKKMGIQPIEYILANNIPFAEGNVIKYVSRWRDKGGVRDLEKALHTLEILIEHEKSR